MRDLFRRTAIILTAVFGAALLGGCQTTSGSADRPSQSAVADNQPDTYEQPPVTFSVYDYSYLPGPKMHVNTCQVAECGPGSKVTYMMFAPTDEHDFDGFKQAQNRAFEALKSRAPQGTTGSIGRQGEIAEGNYKAFISTRELHMPGGNSRYTYSMLLFFDRATVSLISSSPNLESAKANAVVFLLGFTSWSTKG